jgi:pantoate--beta-alanine ligase
MVEDLSLPVSIITSETIREDDGLALSSRNSYLDDKQRLIAPRLYEAIHSTAKELQNGRRNFAELESAARRRLQDTGFEVDYFAIRRAQNLEVPDRDCDDLVVLAAARLGEARLIDNVVITV